jgi:hypothetical protein
MSEKNNSIGMNELVDYKKKEYGKFRGWIMHFLWKCAGADSQILKYAPFSDHIKAAGIGGVVLATTVMATVAMGFAMHTIFGENTPKGVHMGNWAITIPAALVWGIIIFNLDRFIVSTVKGDGTEAITRGELLAMLPRLIMAIIIGLTISAPLETYIFQKEITREWGLSMDQLAISKTYEISQTEEQNYKKNEALVLVQKSKVEIQREIWQKAYQAWEDQMQGRAGAEIGIGPRTKALALTRDEEKIKLTALEDELKTLESRRTGNQEKIKHMQDSVKKAIQKEKPGFLDQLMMLERLSSEGKKVPKFDPSNNTIIKGEYVEIYGSAFWPIWLVRLLFMIVEIAPVIFKFMIWDSSYDYMKDNVAQILEAKQGISLESFPDENNNTHRIRKNYNAERIVEVSKRQNDLEKENAIHAITLYAEQERKEIEDNPEDFVKNKDHDSKPTESNEPENNA